MSAARKTKGKRCSWCGEDPLYVAYHDEEWAVPIWDSKELFAKLILDGAQAGLSWITILRRREGYYAAMDALDPERMARWSDKRIQKLLGDERIIRNRLKVESARSNAIAYLELEEEMGSFSEYLWSYVGGAPIVNRFRELSEIPAETEVSKRLSKDLKKRGFRFVGPTIVYAFLQAAGLVNDHIVSCFRHHEVQEQRVQEQGVQEQKGRRKTRKKRGG